MIFLLVNILTVCGALRCAIWHHLYNLKNASHLGKLLFTFTNSDIISSNKFGWLHTS